MFYLIKIKEIDIYSMIVILGGTGLLGTELQKLDPTLICIGREVDITDYETIHDYLNHHNPDIIVNAAAVINSVEVSKDPVPAIETNIIGAANIAKYCSQHNKRLVYISTDYVYPGTGNHTEQDALYPHNEYAWTKLGGECSSRLVEDYCIIRTSFGNSKFPYPQAYTDLLTSKEYVDVIAPKILEVIKSQYKGIINVGGPKKSSYIYASERNNVMPVESGILKDFSLNTEIFNKIIE